MKRRLFIAGVGAALAGAVLDPERALWVPCAKLISLPAPLPAPIFEFIYLTKVLPHGTRMKVCEALQTMRHQGIAVARRQYPEYAPLLSISLNETVQIPIAGVPHQFFRIA
jgi:hypothetical protein